MSPEKKYFTTTTHDFKTNFAKYIRWMEEGRYDAVFVKRGRETVAFVMPYKKRMKQVIEASEKAERERAVKPSEFQT